MAESRLSAAEGGGVVEKMGRGRVTFKFGSSVRRSMPENDGSH